MPDENPKNAKTGSSHQLRDDTDQTKRPGQGASSKQDHKQDDTCEGASGSMGGSSTSKGAGQRQGWSEADQDEDAVMPGSDARNEQQGAGGSRLAGEGSDRNANKQGDRKNTDQSRGSGNPNQHGQQGNR